MAALCSYARKLTRAPAAVSEADVAALRRAGLDDRAIVDANQVVAYFNYVNRVVEGLGVELEERWPAAVRTRRRYAGDLNAGLPTLDPAALPWLSVDQMREVDRLMVEEVGIALEQMMENAGRNLALLTRLLLGGDARGRAVVVLAGPGGNGGGAMVAARHLVVAGAQVRVLLGAPPERLAPVPAHQHDILRRMGLDVQAGRPALGPADLVVDGLLGYSQAGPPRGDAAELLSDCRSAALVGRDGSVDWLCFPRFDGPSVFARLLDGQAGHFSIRPADARAVTRRYLHQTMVLETTFRTATGTLILVDAMALGPDDRGHHLGANSPGALLRRLDCTAGHITVEVSYAPRPEYGLIHPLLTQADGGLVSRGGADVLALSTAMPLQVDGSTATATISLRAGQTVAFALHHARRWEPPPLLWDQAEIVERLDDAIAGWRSWSRLHQAYEGPWKDLVHHSGRVLQALTFQPTGAIVAAPTTSLPETVGGARNWDYRYTWVRDASLTM